MKYIYILFCMLSFWGVGVVTAQSLSVGNGEDLSKVGGTFNSITVNANGKVAFSGNVTTGLLTIKAEGTMIVIGNLDVVTNGAAKLVINGNLVVTGSLNIKSSGNSEDITVETNGVLVVGGDYTYEGKDSKETNFGKVYLSDPDDWDDGSGLEGNGGDMTDLLNAVPSPIPDDLLDDFIDNYDGDNLPATDWNGSEDSDWDNKNNWASASIPGKAINVTIKKEASKWSSFCTGKVYYMWNLTLEDNAKLTIPAGSQITVFGDISVPATAQLILQSTNDAPTSFIHYGDVIDGSEMTFEWTYASRRYWYIGHPISSPDINSYESIVGDANGNDYLLYGYNNGWVNETGSAAFGDPLQGYSLNVKEEGSAISHSGVPNSGDYSKNLSDGWQLIANPYPSYYQLPTEGLSGSEFINTTGSVYIRTGDTPADRNYATFNTINGIASPEDFSGLIAPCQSFWIQKDAAASGIDIFIRSANCKHDEARSALKSVSTTESNMLRIKLNGLEDETVIAFREGAVNYYSRMDSEKRFDGEDKSYIYSIKDGRSIVINVLPMGNEVSIPLGINTMEGAHSFSFSGVNSIEFGDELLLEDKLTGDFVDLYINESYSFEAIKSKDDSRFVLHLKKTDVPTGIEEMISAEKSERVKVYLDDNSILNVECNWEDIEKAIEIYSLSGQQVMMDTFKGRTYNRPLSIPVGIYLVKVNSNERSFEQKVFVK